MVGDVVWGKETRFGRAARAGGRSVAPTSRAEDSRKPPGIRYAVGGERGPGRDALTSRPSRALGCRRARGPALWGPSRACDRYDGGSRNGPWGTCRDRLPAGPIDAVTGSLEGQPPRISVARACHARGDHAPGSLTTHSICSKTEFAHPTRRACSSHGRGVPITCRPSRSPSDPGWLRATRTGDTTIFQSCGLGGREARNPEIPGQPVSTARATKAHVHSGTPGRRFLIFDTVWSFTSAAHGPSTVRRLLDAMALMSAERLVTSTSSPWKTRLFDQRKPMGAPSSSIPSAVWSCRRQRRGSGGR